MIKFSGDSLTRPADLLKWLAVIASIRFLLFVYFAIQFFFFWNSDEITGLICVHGGDTATYLDPVEDLVNGAGYSSFCRMPGMAPLYGLMYFIGGKLTGAIGLIVLQWLISVVSCWLLARTVHLISGSWLAFRLAAVIGAFSSFLSIWDHYLLSDSLAASWMIFSLWYAAKASRTMSWKLLAVSFFFATWAVFMRPVMLLSFPVLVLWYSGSLRNVFSKQTITGALMASLVPLILFLSWGLYNWQKSGKMIWLVQSPSECFSTNTPEINAVASLVIAWGEDFQKWSTGSCTQWLLDIAPVDAKPPFPERVFVQGCSLDSLEKIRQDYRISRDSAGTEVGRLAGLRVISRSEQLRANYKSQEPVAFYITNRLRLMAKFLFPKRMDVIPGPSFENMSLIQKAIKGGYYVFFLLFNALFVGGTIWIALKKRELMLYALPSLVFLVVLAFILGYIEQRYFVPVYIGNIVFNTIFISRFWNS